MLNLSSSESDPTRKSRVCIIIVLLAQTANFFEIMGDQVVCPCAASSSTKSSCTLAIHSFEKRSTSVNQSRNAEIEPEMPECSSTQADVISSAADSILKPEQA